VSTSGVDQLERPWEDLATWNAYRSPESIVHSQPDVLLRDDLGSTSFVLTAIGLGVVVVGVLIVSNAWKTPTYNLILAWDPEALPADWEAGRQRYFTINWLQLATTWTAFTLFLASLILL
jgi:hypothetical protein